MDLQDFMRRVHAAIARNDGDMYVCQASSFPLVRDWVQIIDLPVMVAGDIVLLKFRPHKRARVAGGQTVPILSYHDGRYYGLAGNTYREKDLIWT